MTAKRKDPRLDGCGKQTATRGLGEHGAALTETLVILPALLLLALGAVQWARIYEAKATLNYAALMAARAGAVHHASTDAMRSALYRALVPLYSPDKTATGLARTYARVAADLAPGYAVLHILNPTAEAFSDFGVNRDGNVEIPNDRLHLRSAALGARSGVNIQDANLLKLKVLYGHQLRVPFVGPVLTRLLSWITTEPVKQAMLRDGRLPILATAIVRMQSAARQAGSVLARATVEQQLVQASTPSATPAGASPGSTPARRPWQSGPSGQATRTGGAGTNGDSGGESGSDPGTGQNNSSAAEPGPPWEGSAQIPPLVPEGTGNPAFCTATLAAQPTALPSQGVGNPIHVVSGNKYQREVDVSALPGALGLRFVRHYNSQDASRRALGFGWGHSYDVTLHVTTSRAYIRQADGRMVVFEFTPDKRKPHYRARHAADGYLVHTGEPYVWHWRSGRRLLFDSRGRLTRVEQGRSRSHAPTLAAKRQLIAYDTARRYAPHGVDLAYDGDGLLTRVSDPQGRTLRLNYYPNAHLKSVIGADDKPLVRYRYDGRGNLSEARYADGTHRIYHYEDVHDRHNLTGITDARGVRLATYGYDKRDRAILSTHAGGVGQVRVRYENGRSIVTDSLGQTSVYYYRIDGGVPLVTRVDGPGCSACGTGNVEYEYDARRQWVATVDKDGGRIERSYNHQGRLTEVYRRRNHRRALLVGYRYSRSTGELIKIVLPSVNTGAQREITLTYNAHGQITVVREQGFAPQPGGGFSSIGREVRYSYDEKNRLRVIDGVRNDVDDRTTIDWDGRNRLRRITYADGGFYAVRRYDAFGRPDIIQTERSPAIHIEYNQRGQVHAFSTAKGRIQFDRDKAGNVTRIGLPQAARFIRNFDDAGRLASIDLDNDLIKLSWDRANQLSALALRDRAGHQAIKANIAIPTRRAGVPSPDPALNREHNAQPQAIILVNDRNGNQTRYGIDDFGRVAFIDSPDSGERVYQHGPGGRLVHKQVASGGHESLAYDEQGRITQVRNAGEDIEVQYSRGRRMVHWPHTSETTLRGDHGPLSRIIEQEHGERFSTGYEYDRHGRVVRKTLPGGVALLYRYDPHASSSSAPIAILRDDAIAATPIVAATPSSTTGVRFGNGLTSWRRYANARLRAIDTDGIAHWRYRYDRRGQMSGIDLDGHVYRRYRYDSANRLVFALTPRQLLGFKYDANGNRLEKVVNGRHVNYRYAHSGNRMLGFSYAGTAIQSTYRTDGALQDLGAYAFDSNANGQPVAIRRDGRTLATYDYDVFAQRTRKTVYDRNGNAHRTGYIYDNGLLIAETDGRGRAVRQYVYFRGRAVAILEGKAIYYVHTNHLGAPIAVSDDQQRVIWRAWYLPFGAAKVSADWDGDGTPFTLQLRLPGQYEDAETGLYYNHYRYYDPQTGRYIAPDPLGLAAGANPYLYAAANPTRYVDPHGLLLFAFDGTNNTDNVGELQKDKMTISNVVRFRDSYLAPAGETATSSGDHYYYITGAGRSDPNFGAPTFLDSATGSSTYARVYFLVNRLMQYLAHIQELGVAGTTLQIDAVGFSRGAANARIFTNTIADIIALSESKRLATWSRKDVGIFDGVYRALSDRWDRLGDGSVYRQVGDVPEPDIPHVLDWVAERFQYLQETCTHLNLRFLGLFDTVPHYGLSQVNDLQQLPLRIPAEVDYAAHAIALNEHRSDFDAVSIHDAATTPNTANRVEAGFIGAHSDIGGSYGEGDLSDVAFMWMVNQAAQAGVKTNYSLIASAKWDIVNNPILHDSVGVCAAAGLYCFGGPDRQIRYLNSIDLEAQKNWSGVGMTQAGTDALHDTQFMDSIRCGRGDVLCRVKGKDLAKDRTKIGAVAPAYNAWLKKHYGLDISIDHTRLNWEQETLTK